MSCCATRNCSLRLILCASVKIILFARTMYHLTRKGVLHIWLKVLMILLVWFLIKGAHGQNGLCGNPFRIKKEHLNLFYTGNHLLDITDIPHAECAKQCMLMPVCNSLIYYPSVGRCLLQSINSTTADPAGFEYRAGVIFSDITEWPFEMAGACGTRLCELDEICFLTTDNYICVKTDCGDLPSLPNGNLVLDVVNGTSIGATATVTCNRGFTSWKVEKITCLGSGSWQSISCSAVHTLSSTLSVPNGGMQGHWVDLDFCGHLKYAAGYRLKLHSTNVTTEDETGLNGIELICKSEAGEFGSYAPQSEVGTFGTWGNEVLCNDSAGTPQFLVSFSLQVEAMDNATNSTTDNTAANFIKFECRDFNGTQPTNELAQTPGYGVHGSYGAWSGTCPAYAAICAISTRIHSTQGNLTDNTALNDVVFRCCI